MPPTPKFPEKRWSKALARMRLLSFWFPQNALQAQGRSSGAVRGAEAAERLTPEFLPTCVLLIAPLFFRAVSPLPTALVALMSGTGSSRTFTCYRKMGLPSEPGLLSSP